MSDRDVRHARNDSTPGTDEVPADAAQVRRLANAVIWPGFVGTSAPAWLCDALADGLAGAVYFAHNIDPDAPGQVAALSAQIRAANPAAVIGVDEEGGNVTRLQAREGSGIPGAAVLGALDDRTTTAAAGRAIGRLCRAAGINLAIAPVADVNTNPRNPVIGVRAFGAEAPLVGTHAAAAIEGIQSMRVGACAKHFPGHGDTVADSHLSAARVELSLDQLTAEHLPPFRAAVNAGVTAVMTAHIIVPELGEAPATLNPRAMGLLRGMGFDGLLVTDALDMAAVRESVGAGEGAVLALLAGADLLCVGNPLNAYTTGRDDEDCYREVRDALVAAVDSGRLPLDVLRRAGARIAAFAAWSGQAPTEPAGQAAADARIDWVDVAARGCSIDRALGFAWLGLKDNFTIVADARTGHNMAAGPTANFLATALEVYRGVQTFAAAGLAGDALAEFADELAERVEHGDQVLVLVDSLADPGQQAVLSAVAELVPTALCINAGVEPANGAGSPLTTVHCHGFSRVTAEAVARLLAVGC
ncbi:glycoside hydrolase family 3 N-terminal domain-containing protein [Specibacter cremeus]|uniref:glycoside hydrolase family 3 N-terminal domain-containing protein n=1 Tax=Specibacter cremeus TaxID=1629051 RepID=UPI000F797DD7|nr:glycoside hydrolase family 3 N-terminal domain-containing protein [Specibacter cremeus]